MNSLGYTNKELAEMLGDKSLKSNTVYFFNYMRGLPPVYHTEAVPVLHVPYADEGTVCRGMRLGNGSSVLYHAVAVQRPYRRGILCATLCLGHTDRMEAVRHHDGRAQGDEGDGGREA